MNQHTPINRAVGKPCPECGKPISRQRQQDLDAAHTFTGGVTRSTPVDDSFYRDQAVSQAVERIAFFWAGGQLADATAWSLVRRLVPDAHAAEMAAIYGTGVAARRKWGLVPAKELRALLVGQVTEADIIRAIDRQDDDPEPEAA